MQVSAREVLGGLLQRCGTCSAYFAGNVALIANDDGQLADHQIEELAVQMHGYHRKHGGD